jgi:hypothetical protein
MIKLGLKQRIINLKNALANFLEYHGNSIIFNFETNMALLKRYSEIGITNKGAKKQGK